MSEVSLAVPDVEIHVDVDLDREVACETTAEPCDLPAKMRYQRGNCKHQSLLCGIHAERIRYLLGLAEMNSARVICALCQERYQPEEGKLMPL